MRLEFGIWLVWLFGGGLGAGVLGEVSSRVCEASVLVDEAFGWALAKLSTPTPTLLREQRVKGFLGNLLLPGPKQTPHPEHSQVLPLLNQACELCKSGQN